MKSNVKLFADETSLFSVVKNESVQYKAVLAITGAIQGTSQEKHSDELGLETLKSRRWLRRLDCIYKVINTGIPKYLTDLILKHEIGCNTRIGNKLSLLIAELKILKIRFSVYY